MTHISFTSKALVAAAFVMTLAACGGGSGNDAPTNGGSSGTSPPVDVQPAAIEGIATPSSVSVVTATNAS